MILFYNNTVEIVDTSGLILSRLRPDNKKKVKDTIVEREFKDEDEFNIHIIIKRTLSNQ